MIDVADVFRRFAADYPFGSRRVDTAFTIWRAQAEVTSSTLPHRRTR